MSARGGILGASWVASPCTGFVYALAQVRTWGQARDVHMMDLIIKSEAEEIADSGAVLIVSFLFHSSEAKEF
jgi:frataxin-like iron-binding protein CyaY